MKNFKSQRIFEKKNLSLLIGSKNQKRIIKYHKKNYLWYDDGLLNVAYNCLEKI